MRPYLKQPLIRFFTLAVLAMVLMASCLVPRSFIFIVSGGLAIALTALPLSEALAWFALFMPLSLALPFSNGFDTLASWRILAIILFVKWLWQARGFSNFSAGLRWFIIGLTAFLGWSALALLAAHGAVGPGFRQLLLFANAFILVPVYAATIRTQAVFNRVFWAALAGAAGVLLIGLLQELSVFFISLFDFWQAWARHAVPLFAGSQTGQLLTYANTWFSYWSNDAATLRIFSVFQDSHSFALFMIFGGILVTAAWRAVNRRAFWLLAFILLSIVLSGTRGSWLGIIGVAALLGATFFHSKFMMASASFRTSLVAIILIFLAAFPVASAIWVGSMFAQSNQKGGLSEAAILSFERARSIFNFEETSNKGRLEIWQASVKSIEARPIFGVGAGNFPTVLNQQVAKSRQGSSAHSLYLQLAAESGIPGLVFFLALLGFIGLYARRVALHSAGLMQAFSIAFIIYFTWALSYSLVDVVWLNDRVLSFFALIVGLLFSFNFLNTHDTAAVPTRGGR